MVLTRWLYPKTAGRYESQRWKLPVTPTGCRNDLNCPVSHGSLHGPNLPLGGPGNEDDWKPRQRIARAVYLLLLIHRCKEEYMEE